MPKNTKQEATELSITQQFHYLEEIDQETYDDSGLIVPAQFSSIVQGNPNTVKVDGVYADRNKFCAEGFPEQNIEEFLMIPLHVNAMMRIMYKDQYKGESVPPDCQSLDSLRPIEPLQFNGSQITSCGTCPLYGFGKNYKCHNKPLLIGLAYFPDANGLLVPVRKGIPAMSIKNFNGFVRELTKPVYINGQPKKIPHHMRMVKVGLEMVPNKTYGGEMAIWTFKLLTPDNAGTDPAFVPTDLVDESRKFLPLAAAFAKADVRVAPQALPSLPVQVQMASLPGESAKAQVVGSPQGAQVSSDEANAYY